MYFIKVLRTGNSLCVTIPSRASRIMGLKKGLRVKAEPDLLNGKITYTFIRPSQLPLLGKKE